MEPLKITIEDKGNGVAVHFTGGASGKQVIMFMLHAAHSVLDSIWGHLKDIAIGPSRTQAVLYAMFLENVADAMERCREKVDATDEEIEKAITEFEEFLGE